MPGRKVLAVVLAFYFLVAAVATFPMILSIRSAVASNVDPVMHLTIMRWYKTCLFEGRSPFRFDEIQHPLGAPIGNFPPMVLQTVAYIALSSVIDNDILCYNILWFAAFLLAGMGTFLLAYRVVGDTACSVFAGVAVMLGGPMMLHSHGHLELMLVGWFSLFLLAWIRFVDRPNARSMAAAAAAYTVMTLCTAYFAVLAVVPAAWYLVLGAIASLRRGDRGWLRPRATWTLGFVASVVPFLLLAFAGQLWNVAHGLSMNRSRVEFSIYGVPWYGYVVPSGLHRLHGLFGAEAYDAKGHPAVECASYLGLATLGLIGYAAIRRVGFRKASFWWSVSAILVVFSFGATLELGRIRLPLPASWLYDHFFVFRMLRAPGRFNLFASVAVAVVASAGLKHLIARWSRPTARWSACGVFMMVAILDLSMTPFPLHQIPQAPAFYNAIVRADPSATFLDAPLSHSCQAQPLTAVCGYWQSFHGGRTTAGYSSHGNIPFDNQLVHNTPFSLEMMSEPGYLADPESSTFGIVADVRFLDYAWLYLASQDLRYMVLHRSPDLVGSLPTGRDKLEGLLQPARIFEDESTAVFDSRRLARPSKPVVACKAGWRGGWHGRSVLIASKVAEVAAYNPDPDRDLTLTLGVKSFREARNVRICSGGVELANWQVRPDLEHTFISPPFRLPAGLQTLTIESDGEERPVHRYELAIAGDRLPYSLIVSRVSLQVANLALGKAVPKPDEAVGGSMRR
jgi:hypothetical protein